MRAMCAGRKLGHCDQPEWKLLAPVKNLRLDDVQSTQTAATSGGSRLSERSRALKRRA
jgi:hypothetical protein